jgi:hypothetical protein
LGHQDLRVRLSLQLLATARINGSNDLNLAPVAPVIL